MHCKIAHIGDIHIKNKYVEYYELLDILHDNSPDVIVLTGDIIDSVINITPAVILDVNTFLTSLTNIAPVVMIPGNHDISCKINDIDFFTAITTNSNDLLKPPRFNYWRHSGQYDFKNILWTVIAPDEDIPSYSFDIKTQILLFHETLDRLNIESFNIFTAVMAGHMHTRQLINHNGAYCGSLFQQNINESHNGHGFVMWDIFNDSAISTFIDIKNKFGFLKVELDNNIDVTEQPIPESVVLYDVYYSNTDPDELNNIINKYIDKYGFKPRNVKDKNKYNIEGIKNDAFVNINDISLHNTLIRTYLKDKDTEYIQNIINLHKHYYTLYYNYQESNNGKLRLLFLSFENMYIFEGNHYIDFTKMERKLSGIIGANNTGKTALIDIILFALYDVHPRISSKKCIINKDCTTYNLSLEFEINGKIGVIKKGSSYKFTYDNKDMTQKTIPLTINEIKKIVGDYNNAILSSFQLQYNYNNFTNMTPTIRKQKLAELLSLRVFENIEDEVAKEINELMGKQKVFNCLKSYSEDEEDTSIETKIKSIQCQIKYANLLDINAQENETDNDNKKSGKEIVEQLIDIEGNKQDIQVYESMIQAKNMISRLETERGMLYAILEENKALIIDHPNARCEYEHCKKENERINNIINDINKSINEFEPVYIKDAVISKYKTFGISYLYKLCKVEKDEKGIAIPAASIACLLLERDHNIRLNETLHAKLIICEKVMEQMKYMAQIDSINKTIQEIKQTYHNLSNMVNNTNKLYFSLYEEYKKYVQRDLEQFRKKELALLVKNLDTLKIYRQIIKPTNGIINLLLNNICPTIESKVNNMLINTNIKIMINSDFDILYDVNGHWLDISLSSGYQKFILNLVFRIVLWQVADVVIPDAIFIDEGFGMCDNENITIINELLHSIVKNNEMPKIIFIVSHVNYLIDNIESPLFIENGKIVSRHVKFTESFTDLTDSVIEPQDELITESIVISQDNSVGTIETIETTETTETIETVTDKTQPELTSELLDELISVVDNDKYYCSSCNVYIKTSHKNKHIATAKHKKNI